MNILLGNKDLITAYNVVSNRFNLKGNLNFKDFIESRNIYEPNSLNQLTPKPKQLEVIAVVCGLPFSNSLTLKLQTIQNQVQEILGSTLSYWVKPQNLAIEFFVIKWPDEIFQKEQLNIGKEFLNNFNKSKFHVHFNGFQIHRDGCVVARGIDTQAKIRKARLLLLKDQKIPVRQSNWSHVPLGRILEPFSDKAYSTLKTLVKESQKNIFHSELIENVLLVHEKRWYMEEREIIHSKKLAP